VIVFVKVMGDKVPKQVKAGTQRHLHGCQPDPLGNLNFFVSKVAASVFLRYNKGTARA
jgi:hypothetical protein